MKCYTYFRDHVTILEPSSYDKEFHSHTSKLFIISIACNSKILETTSINREVYVFGGPRTTLRFNALQDGLTERGKMIILMDIADYSERMQIKISN